MNISNTDMTYKHYFGVSATFRNEKPYLKEWIDFHLKVGAEIIFLFDDRSTDNPLEVLQPYIERNKVIYNKADKHKQRFPHVRQVVNTYKNLCKWVAFIDIDEFLHSTKNEKIVKILREFERSDIKAIYVNWLCYGNSWKNKEGKEGVLQRFTRRSDKMFGLNSEVKSIVQPEVIKDLKTSHIFSLKSGVFYYNDKKEKGKLGEINQQFHDNFDQHIKPYFEAYNKDKVVTITKKTAISKMRQKQYPPSYHRLCINHYITKSREEFMGKAKRYDFKRQDRYSTNVFNDINKHLNKVNDPLIW